MRDDWYVEYLGKPWCGIPDPPKSFNCGELIRHVYHRFFNVRLVPIPVSNAENLRDVISAMVPDFFGFASVDGDLSSFDCVFMSRRFVMDHCGIVIKTSEGVQILHCASPCGVVVNSPLELMTEYGYSRLNYFRHPDVRLQCQKLCL